MALEKGTLYIKGEQNTEVASLDVTLGDLLTMEFTDPHVVSKLKTQKVLKIPKQGQHRFVISILKIIECIHKEYPNLEIQNVGPADLIVTYEAQQPKNKLMEACKVGAVTLITFVGSAFAIITFNNDSGVPDIFDNIYKMFMGTPKMGVSILEIAYSVGILIGILIFFNHFGKRKFSVDPTPIEVEMRLYEKDIQTTLIDDYARKGQEMDAGQTINHGDHRP